MPQTSQLEVGITVSDGACEVDHQRLTSLLRLAARCESRNGEVGLWICNDVEIAELHLRFMDIPGPTDVISFPGDAPYLGDIAVSGDTAAAQAAEFGHSTKREISYLALHGLLHLLGYDDLTSEDRERMIARQDEIMSTFEQQEPGVW